MLCLPTKFPHPPRFLLNLSLLALLLGMGIGMAAPAQAECERELRDIDRVWELLRMEEPRLRECNLEQVRSMLQQSAKQLREAERRGSRGECSRARGHVNAAHRLIVTALDLCRDEDQSGNQVLDFLNRTDELFHDLADRVGADSEECRRLLQVAREQQKRGWQQYRSGNLRFALSLSAGARRSGERVLRCGDGQFQSEDEAQRVLGHTDQLLEDALRILGDRGASPDAAGRLDHARRMQHQAWRQFRNPEPRYLLAIRLSEQARVIAAGSLARVEPDLDPEGVLHMIETTRHLLDQLDEVATEETPAAIELLRRARGLLHEAERFNAEGEYRRAVARVRTSSSLALQVAGFLEEERDP